VFLQIQLEVVSPRKKKKHPNHPSPPFKKKEKVGEGRSKAWWPMEGEGEGSFLPLPLSPPINFT
jgi:hypothetical protein